MRLVLRRCKCRTVRVGKCRRKRAGLLHTDSSQRVGRRARHAGMKIATAGAPAAISRMDDGADACERTARRICVLFVFMARSRRHRAAKTHAVRWMIEQ